MRILFFMRGAVHLGSFEPLRLLAERGHGVHVVIDEHPRSGSNDFMEQLRGRYPQIRCSLAPAIPFNAWSFLGLELRRAIDYLWCLDSELGRTPKPDLSCEHNPPPFVIAALELPMVGSSAGRWLLRRLLHWCDRAVPSQPVVNDFLRAENPDLVLVTSSIDRALQHVDYVRSARALGVPTVACVDSGDNVRRERLATDALELVTIWNEPAKDLEQQDRAATNALAAALEGMAARGSRRRDPGASWAVFVRPVLARIAARLARTERGQKEKAAHKRQLRELRKANLFARRAEVSAAKRRAETESALRRQAVDERLAAERLATERIAAKAYEDYLHVRDRARHMRAQSNGAAMALTDAERQTMNALAHFWDAAPITIANLRRWCEPISGVRVSDYDSESLELFVRLKRDLRGLRGQVGRELFVEEPSTLGGFGYIRRGERYNEDTLKFFNVLVALQDGGVLGECRCTTRRRLVWEIGGGWGGFGYQFKTICPNVTYLITGIPDLFLVSAVYLMSVFPDARFRFYGGSSPDEFLQSWESVDFLFAPETALATLRTPGIDLTIDVMTLHNMSAKRVEYHVQRAYEAGSRYFYTLLRDKGAASEPQTIVKAIERLYWPHPVPSRNDMDRPVTDVDWTAPPPYSDHTHLVGWRRMRA